MNETTKVYIRLFLGVSILCLGVLGWVVLGFFPEISILLGIVGIAMAAQALE